MYAELIEAQARSPKGRGRSARISFAAAHVAMRRALVPEDTVRIAVGAGKDALQAREYPATADLLDVLGAAIRNRTRKNGKIALAWATAAKADNLRDALETARAHKLPVVFVREMDEPEEQGSAGGLLNRKVAAGEEMPHIIVDGNDVVAAYRVAHEAIDRARRDRGPTLIDCVSFRVKGHGGRHLDPVANMERYLCARGLLKKK